MQLHWRLGSFDAAKVNSWLNRRLIVFTHAGRPMKLEVTDRFGAKKEQRYVVGIAKRVNVVDEKVGQRRYGGRNCHRGEDDAC